MLTPLCKRGAGGILGIVFNSIDESGALPQKKRNAYPSLHGIMQRCNGFGLG